MKIRVLGCSGGIGTPRHTTSFLVDDDILVDAGSGVMSLTLGALARIDKAFITHAHLDHVMSLPSLLDSVSDERGRPLVVHALPGVLDVLRDHLFNWRLWPDFAEIPSREAPFLSYRALEVGQSFRFGRREIIPIPARHGVPAVGYLMRGPGGSLIFSGDTASHDALWDIANATPDLRHLIVEVSFGDALRRLAEVSNHYCPATLLADLPRLKPGVQVWVTHLKPGREADILAELRAGLRPGQRLAPLVEGQVFELDEVW